MSITINVPVRPIPALQWTRIGPMHGSSWSFGTKDAAIDSCLAFTSCKKFSTQPGSDGTPWSGHALNQI